MTDHAPGDEFRRVIVEAVERQQRSRYWLAKAVAADERVSVSEDAVYRYLRGESDTTGAVIAACMRALDLPSIEIG
jgi:hypothetical protein